MCIYIYIERERDVRTHTHTSTYVLRPDAGEALDPELLVLGGYHSIV